MSQKVLWTIRTNTTLTADVWDQFVNKAREAGMTPARVLQEFILGYIAGASDTPTTPTKESNHAD